jgi:hypothetical protein
MGPPRPSPSVLRGRVVAGQSLVAPWSFSSETSAQRREIDAERRLTILSAAAVQPIAKGGEVQMPEQESRSRGPSAGLITAIAALITALGGVYVAVREPNAQKVSDASEAISKANQDEHDQLVKLIQAVDDISKNVDQNRAAVTSLQTYVDTSLAGMRRPIGRPDKSGAPAPVASAPPPVIPALHTVMVPQAPARPPSWNAATNTLVR